MGRAMQKKTVSILPMTDMRMFHLRNKVWAIYFFFNFVHFFLFIYLFYFFFFFWGGYRTVGCSYVASAEKRVSYPKIRVSLGNKALNAHTLLYSFAIKKASFSH